jgi:hypothetical protein
MTRISERDLLCVQSSVTVEAQFDRVVEILKNFEIRKDWDHTLQEFEVKKQFSDVADIIYLKSKKLAVVGSRYQFQMVTHKNVEAGRSKSGKIEYIQCFKSIENAELLHDSSDSCVKAETIFGGY